MLHHQLLHFVSHLASAGRHALTYGDAASQALLGIFISSNRHEMHFALRSGRRAPRGGEDYE
jgi:hypothetical protein